MADNTNVEAIRVCNEAIRPTCDRMMQIYYYCKTMQDLYVQQGWATLFPAGDPTGVIIDGSAEDGRNAITNGDVQNVVTSVNALITLFEQNSNQVKNRFLIPAVNPQRV